MLNNFPQRLDKQSAMKLIAIGNQSADPSHGPAGLANDMRLRESGPYDLWKSSVLGDGRYSFRMSGWNREELITVSKKERRQVPNNRLKITMPLLS